jgi:hypothetical protein
MENPMLMMLYQKFEKIKVTEHCLMSVSKFSVIADGQNIEMNGRDGSILACKALN